MRGRLVLGTVVVTLLLTTGYGFGPFCGVIPAGAAGTASARSTGESPGPAEVKIRTVILDGRPAREIMVCDQVVFRVRVELGGLTVDQRAQIIARRLSNLLEETSDFGPRLHPDVIAGQVVVRGGDRMLVTVDEVTALYNSTTPSRLALIWANNLRRALGKPELEASELPKVMPRSKTLRVFYGVASWYGPGFDGNLTASGEVYDQKEFTAAHRWFPFSTMVLVTDLDTKKRVMVRINDRGPWIEGRSIDLSMGAASTLGLINRGLARVKMEILEPVRQD